MPHRVLDTADDLADLVTFLRGLKLPITVSWVKGRDRSRDQNNLQWMWAEEVAEQFGDRDQDEVQRDWKLRHGVPILRKDDVEFREWYDQNLKGLTFEAKSKAMTYLDVTSIMKVRQMVRYLDAIQRECLSQGLRLTDPDPMLAGYQARYRAKETA